MKISHSIIAGLSLLTSGIQAEPALEAQKETPADIIEKHGAGAQKLAYEQDELSADVQDLTDEQTDPKVIELLQEVETIMADAIDQLEQKDTGGATIATQTEVIEKIFEAAKKKKQQSQSEGEGEGQQQAQEGMMEMLKRMMDGGQDQGKGQQPGEGKQPGQGAGQQPGEGQGGDGASNGGDSGDPDNTAEGGQRRVPRNSGKSGNSVPREYQKAMDAYNKGAAKKSSQR